ncbi:Uncharacterised protein [Chromobacterium violaceum]|uniref:Uncharacterized protein n=1 Tax=Chromobacterium violaceum TaxID=536 RepID=A0A3S4HMY2_CHRVL|nr:Uncharacterised protein [Chromobacterium violaceum]
MARELLDEKQLTRMIETDGSLPARDLSLQLAETLAAEVWGKASRCRISTTSSWW